MKTTLVLLSSVLAKPEVRTPSQAILQKLNLLAQDWAEFFIGDVLNRQGRADNFKERIERRLTKLDEHYVTCQSKGYERRRRRRSKALTAIVSNDMFDEFSGRQIRELSTDPLRSNAQIFVNIRNWIARNMQECPQALRHFEKMGELQEKWTAVFNTVLKKIDQKRSKW